MQYVMLAILDLRSCEALSFLPYNSCHHPVLLLLLLHQAVALGLAIAGSIDVKLHDSSNSGLTCVGPVLLLTFSLVAASCTSCEATARSGHWLLA